jgi:hypothetical protein
MSWMREPAESDSAVIAAAHAALLEITEEATVGPLLGVDEPEEGVVDVLYSSAMPGYPDWRWTVSVSVLDGADAPSVLELELLPGDGSILAPEWVPWSDRVTDADTMDAGDESDDDDDSDDDEDDDDPDDDEDADEDLEDDLDGDDSDVDEIDLLASVDDDIDGVDFEAADFAASGGGDGDDDDDDDDDPAGDAPATSGTDVYDDVDPFAPLPGTEDDDPFIERSY